jgi:hypothetical protein
VCAAVVPPVPPSATAVVAATMHVDFIRTTRRRVGVLAAIGALALTPSTALAALAKPKPKPKPIAPYITYKLSEVQIS